MKKNYKTTFTNVSKMFLASLIFCSIGLSAQNYFLKQVIVLNEASFGNFVTVGTYDPVSKIYEDFFEVLDMKFIKEPKDSKSNYWLNAIMLDSKEQRDLFLEYTNNHGVMTRPIWTLMNKLEMFKTCQCGDLSNAIYLEERIVNIPSSVRV